MPQLVILLSQFACPTLIAAAGDRAQIPFLEFFASNIRKHSGSRKHSVKHSEALRVTRHSPLRVTALSTALRDAQGQDAQGQVFP